MGSACLVDTTRCVGCRSCQVACKQSNGLADERTKFFAAPGGYQNPRRFSSRTFTYVSYHEQEDASGEPIWAFVKHQCMHCAAMYCATVCGPQVFRKTESGAIVYEADNCMGCAACVGACPFEVPAIEYWDVAVPQIRKCSFCLTRQESEGEELEIDGEPLSPAALQRHQRSFRTPACAKACPADAIAFGDRDELLAESKRRIAAEPGKYVDHVYGEKEAGGTGWLYLARVPFEKLGFPVRFDAFEAYRKKEHLGATGGRRSPLASLKTAAGALAAGLLWMVKRRDDLGSSARGGWI